MHADDFRLDHCGVVSGLRDGGYSDDMTLAAIAGISVFLFSNCLKAIGSSQIIELLGVDLYQLCG